ncbi:MAG: hypothetical protein ACLPN5_21085 [Roseiarcus sp.]
MGVAEICAAVIALAGACAIARRLGAAIQWRRAACRVRGLCVYDHLISIGWNTPRARRKAELAFYVTLKLAPDERDAA